MSKQTSLQSWQDCQPELPMQQAKVFDALRRLGGAATDRQIAIVLNHPRSLVAARRRELEQQGILWAAGETYDNVTNRTVTVWRIK